MQYMGIYIHTYVVCMGVRMYVCMYVCTVYVETFEGLFCGFIFADHQVEYIVSSSHCFF